MNEFIEQKKKEYQRFLKEATHIEVGSQLEIQLTSQLENYITESYNKGVEDAIEKAIEIDNNFGNDDAKLINSITYHLEQLKEQK